MIGDDNLPLILYRYTYTVADPGLNFGEGMEGAKVQKVHFLQNWLNTV